MINTFDEIIRAALALPPNSRVILVEQLLSSLDESAVDIAWAEVVEHRIQEIQQGKVECISSDQVLQELRNRHGL
jgi:putative addiction module component (TIGR02574 family)